MRIEIRDWDLENEDWGLRLIIKIKVFDFGDRTFGIRIEDWDRGSG